MEVRVLGRLIEDSGHEANAWRPIEVRPSGRADTDPKDVLWSKAKSSMVVRLLGRSTEVRPHLEKAELKAKS